mgnify:CR=1 FL=1
MSINRILFTFMALFLAAYSLWNGENLEGIGWLALIELDRINQALILPKKRDPKSEAKELARLFQASLDKQPKNS